MTVIEFEAWVSDNYDELLSRWIEGNRDGQDEQDAFHSALEGMLANGLETVNARMDSEPDFNLFIWTMNQIRGYLKSIRGSRRARAEAMEDFSNQGVLGDDRFADPERDRVKRHQRNLRLKQNGSLEHSYQLEEEASNEMRLGHLFYGQVGSIRFNYQTRRDNALFGKKAMQSLGERVRQTTDRYHHFGEPGNPYSEFGLGVSL